MTPLHLAAGRGHINIIKEIILRCTDCYELVDHKGWNVLHFAMGTLNKDKLLDLVENPLIKKLIHEKDVNGNTPFHVLATITPYFYFTFFYRIINKVKGDIKAVNNNNVSVFNVFTMIGYPELQKQISELSKETGDGSYPLGVTGREYFRIEKSGLELLEKARDSHIVAAALIATVTFAAAFTLPDGFKNEVGKNQGMAILSRNSAFQTFVISDAIAMVFSTFSVFSYFFMALEVLPRRKYFILFATATWFAVIAMAAMVIAFVTGTYAVLSPALGLAIATCLIGLTVFLLLAYVGYIFFKEI
ncbi:hypothetical protein Ddye_022368 [Dipteronia dyeriana]|uniref:PGG domain-containing protein n=1 Tax=Dipteronia dyeriana TaxID=168575 RepID=A0AAD9U444_9ROSI|nr:hypothetical protein Ddye_022368 [Dipteronia dyeriana]